MSEFNNDPNLNEDQNNIESTEHTSSVDSQENTPKKGLFGKKEKKVKEVKKEKKTKTPFQKKKARRKFMNFIMGVVVFCTLLGALSGVSIIKLVLSKTDVVLDISDLKNTESSIIYDDAGNQIALLGKENRISASYNRMPQVVIDAFISIEDSRYFEHPGFDLPRFAKAFLEVVKSFSFSQGGSTITMQVIKNTYFAVDTIAEKSIDRKIQEIYYSLQINKIVSKERILELYINKVNYGATARGIQIASNYYFNKDCSELNLVEAAMLAGIVNAPNANNPYVNLENCKKRTNEVLYQMYNHGYITESEYALAKKVKIENLLYGTNESSFGTGVTVDNQAYIDVVIDELFDVYGINPYTTPVKVYTCMNQGVQHYCDEVSRGNVRTFKDNYINIALALIENNTGRLVGICGGRDYDTARRFNFATDNRINPGSTAKAIFTYPLAFEYAGLGTNYYVTDEPTALSGTSIKVNEARAYYGQWSVQRAFTLSFNIAAIKMYRWVNSTVGVGVMKSYLKNIGMDPVVYNNVNEQYAIGAQNFQCSPVQMAAAQSAVLSGGVYHTPHTILKIEFINSDEAPIIADVEGVRVLSTEGAWLASYLSQVAVNGGATASDWVAYGRLNNIKHRNYVVYGKTGTSLYDKTVTKKYGMPSQSAKDWTLLGGTSKFAFVFWAGYDFGGHLDKTTYIPETYKQTSRFDSDIVNGLLAVAEKEYGTPANSNPRPAGVTTLTHAIATYPYTALPSYADSKYQVTSFIKKEFASVQSWPTPEIESVANFTATASGNTVSVTFTPYPDESKTVVADKLMTFTWGSTTYEAPEGRKIDDTWVDGVIQYAVEVEDTVTHEKTYHTVDGPTGTFTINNESEQPKQYIIRGYYEYSIAPVRSAYIQQTVTIAGKTVTPPVEEPTPEEP